MRRYDRLLLAPLAAMAISVAACIVEPPGPPSLRAILQPASFVLTADQPVVTRTLRFRALPGEMAVRTVEAFLAVNGEGGGGPSGAVHPDVWVSILDPATGASSDYGTGNGHASVDGWGHGPDCDVIPCDRSWTVIARWLDPHAGEEIPLELEASITAWAERPVQKDDPPFEMKDISVVERPEPLFEGGYAVTRARVSGSAQVGPASKPDVRHLVLRVPALLLAGDPRLPRLGRIFLGTTVTDWSGRPVDLRATLSFADRTAGPYGGIAGEVEWLSLCRPREECEIPMDLTFTYWQSPEYWPPDKGTPAPDGFMAIDWFAEARLEDFGSNTPMPAGLELVEVPEGT